MCLFHVVLSHCLLRHLRHIHAMDHVPGLVLLEELPPGWSIVDGRYWDHLKQISQSVRPEPSQYKHWNLKKERGEPYWQCDESPSHDNFWVLDPFPWGAHVDVHGSVYWQNTHSDLRFFEHDQVFDIQVTIPCKHFQRGNCYRGDRCLYEHVLVPCQRFQRDSCFRGRGCIYHHASDTPESHAGPSSSSSTMNINQKQHINPDESFKKKPCNRFQHGLCQRGDCCKYEHVIVLCHKFQRNKCTDGAQCRRSHQIHHESDKAPETSWSQWSSETSSSCSSWVSAVWHTDKAVRSPGNWQDWNNAWHDYDWHADKAGNNPN
jgi:hypothetical protein